MIQYQYQLILMHTIFVQLIFTFYIQNKNGLFNKNIIIKTCIEIQPHITGLLFTTDTSDKNSKPNTKTSTQTYIIHYCHYVYIFIFIFNNIFVFHGFIMVIE